ncbi:MAG: hypothetical protein QGH33_08245 [Pirellulaceae bacterium]|nr:hypothetical protein [Pirellulaceae bacterium]
MSTSLLDEPVTQASSASQRLRTTMAAMRLSFTWFGTHKSLSPQQMAQAADTFGAEQYFFSAGKKLLDTRDPTFRAVTAIRGQASCYFRGISLPYPEPGIRLIRQSDIDELNVRMGAFKQELDDAVDTLSDRFDELKQTARERLGDLFNPNDYPLTLSGLFDMTWDFPSVEPPQYLQQLNPSLYERECSRVRSRFDEAVQLAEAAFTEELAKLVEHLSERITGEVDGRPKVFRDGVVENLHSFFERFRTLNIRSNDQLDELVDQVQQVVRGVEPQQLRDRQSLRQQIATQLSSVQSSLDQMLVDRPRRNILRRAR